jgi:secondary thiamine-phosphate synthase enzyme
VIGSDRSAADVAERTIETTRRIQAIDVTEVIAHEAWPDGLVWVTTPHTTTALVIGEGDPDMLADYESVAARLFEPLEPFRHHRNDNPNAAAHLVSSFAGTQLIIPATGGRLAMGRFQRLILLELDGPRTRMLRAVAIPTVSADRSGQP